VILSGSTIKNLKAATPVQFTPTSNEITISCDTYDKATTDSRISAATSNKQTAFAVSSRIGSYPLLTQPDNTLKSLTFNTPLSVVNNWDNLDISVDAYSKAQSDTALALKANSTGATLTNTTFAGTVTGLTKTNVGLGNVDNTSDASKPVSTATSTALALKANLANPTFSDDGQLDGQQFLR
jgi:hypothetical protein